MQNPIAALLRRTPLGWLQLSRQKSKLLVALSGIAFADVLIFMQLGFQGALYESSVRSHQLLNTDAVIFSPQALNIGNLGTFPRRRLLQAQDIAGVESTHAMYISNVVWRNPQTRKETLIRVMGFDPNYLAIELPGVKKNLDRIKIPDTFLFDVKTLGRYNEVIATLDRGEKVLTEIEHKTITLAGSFTLGTSFGSDGHLITSDQNFLRLFPRRPVQNISLGLLKLAPGSDPDRVVAQLRQHLPNDTVVMTKAEFIEFEMAYWQKSTSIGFIFSIGVAMGFVVGIVIVYQVLSTDVNAHMGEYATFKAMGYDNLYLLGVVFEEAAILAFLGFFPGVAGAMGLYTLARNATGLPMFMTVARASTVLMLTLLICAISGAIATRKLQGADPADMF